MAGEPQRLKLEIATPSGLALQAEVDSVQAPSVDGEFGVLPMHLPILAALKSGVVIYDADHKRHVAAIGHGFIEAGPDKVLLLTEMYLEPHEIDPEAAARDQHAAEEALKAFEEAYEGPEYHDLQRNIDWAVAQQEAYRVSREAEVSIRPPA